MIHIYKILTPQQWDAFQESGVFKGAPIDLADGYIHFSSRAQVEATANKHFSTHDLIIVCLCDTDLIEQDIVWEPSRGADLFPHLYSQLNIDAVAAHVPILRGTNGFNILKALPENLKDEPS